jgi:hypothetical protein
LYSRQHKYRLVFCKTSFKYSIDIPWYAYQKP